MGQAFVAVNLTQFWGRYGNGPRYPRQLPRDHRGFQAPMVHAAGDLSQVSVVLSSKVSVNFLEVWLKIQVTAKCHY